jgi:hypothetical protein
MCTQSHYQILYQGLRLGKYFYMVQEMRVTNAYKLAYACRLFMSKDCNRERCFANTAKHTLERLGVGGFKLPCTCKR